MKDEFTPEGYTTNFNSTLKCLSRRLRATIFDIKALFKRITSGF